MQKYGRGKQPVGSAAAPTGIPVELMNTDDTKAKQRGKDGTRKTLEKVQFSTASMGKFDKMREGEAERKQKGKRNHFLPLTGAEKTEKERSMNVLKRVIGREENAGKAKGKTYDDEDEAEGGGKRKKVRLLSVVFLLLRVKCANGLAMARCRVARSCATSPRAAPRSGGPSKRSRSHFMGLDAVALASSS